MQARSPAYQPAITQIKPSPGTLAQPTLYQKQVTPAQPAPFAMQLFHHSLQHLDPDRGWHPAPCDHIHADT
jgi:hypothetical protein